METETQTKTGDGTRNEERAVGEGPAYYAARKHSGARAEVNDGLPSGQQRVPTVQKRDRAGGGLGSNQPPSFRRPM